MRVTRFDHAAVTVSSTQAALEFYVGVLGMRVVEAHELPTDKISTAFGLPGASGRSTRLAAGGDEVLFDIMEMTSDHGPATPPSIARVGTGHVAFEVEDLDGMLEHVRAAGGRPFSEPVRFDLNDGGAVVVCFLRDPDGNIVELSETVDS